MTTLSTKLGGKLVEILGLPKNTRACELRFAVGEPVIVKCEYFPDGDLGGLETILCEYTLVPKDV